MTKNIQGRKSLALAIAMLGAGGTAGVVPAAYAEEAATGSVEEVVVTGLRGRPRTATDSAVAIDTFDVETIEQVSFQDTQDVLQTLIPSYNVSRVPIGDGLTFIRPATLRGLPTHHTLVLVNGKRRHRASLVQLGGDGTQGPDVATIPTYAIQSVEVLRDGASSQYGSDAIAGVINFNLKDNREGFSFAYDTGEFYEGDGFQQTLMGNVGLPLGENGFLSISGEYTDSEFTERAEQYCTGGFCITDPSTAPGDPSAVPGGLSDADIVNSQRYQNAVGNAATYGDNVIPWGTPNIEPTRLFYNAGYDFDGGVELYSYGNYSQSTGDGPFFYRFPGNSVLADRRLEDGTRWNPAFNDDGPGPSFPAGFTPGFEGEITDYSVLGGVRGGDEYGFTWDFSARYGYNEIAYSLFNTYNPSLGPTSPTSFEPGTLSNQEIQIQLDMAQELDFGLVTPAVFAFGLSYLDEEYEVEQTDDVASYAAGPWSVADPFGFCEDGAPTAAGAALDAGVGLDCANPDDPVYRAFPVGSNGFPGYSPEFSGTYTRESYAAYADLSFDLTPKLFLQTAIRFEDYTDFGTQTVAKIAGRYRINDQFAIRSSVGTGFRAPTPGQQGTINVATVLPFGVPIAEGTFPPGGPVAQALGANELEPETAVNYTLGATADFDNGLTITADLYRIEIDDRTRFISARDVNPNADPGTPARENFEALAAAGVPGANTIGQVSWLTNAFDTVTTGFDLVASYPLDWGDAGSTTLSAAINWNDFRAEGNFEEFLDTEDLFDFENTLPNWRGVYTAVHTINQFTIMLRGSYFGEYENAQEDGNGGPISGPGLPPNAGIQTFDGVWFFDLEGSWQVNQNVRVTLGGRNIFDEFPDELNTIGRSDQCCGRVYDSGSVVPWQGGYYYGRIAAEF
jgi:iron complex outermembrane receptor protein